MVATTSTRLAIIDGGEESNVHEAAVTLPVPPDHSQKFLGFAIIALLLILIVGKKILF